jgi:hypothetical protein
VKRHATRTILCEDPIQHERVNMDVEIERPAEPLHDGHGTPATLRHHRRLVGDCSLQDGDIIAGATRLLYRTAAGGGTTETVRPPAR